MLCSAQHYLTTREGRAKALSGQMEELETGQNLRCDEYDLGAGEYESLDVEDVVQTAGHPLHHY